MTLSAEIMNSYEPEQVEQKYEMNWTIKQGVQRFKHMAQDNGLYERKPSTEKIDYKSYVHLGRAIKDSYNRRGIRNDTIRKIYKNTVIY